MWPEPACETILITSCRKKFAISSKNFSFFSCNSCMSDAFQFLIRARWFLALKNIRCRDQNVCPGLHGALPYFGVHAAVNLNCSIGELPPQKFYLLKHERHEFLLREPGVHREHLDGLDRPAIREGVLRRRLRIQREHQFRAMRRARLEQNTENILRRRLRSEERRV